MIKTEKNSKVKQKFADKNVQNSISLEESFISENTVKNNKSNTS